MLGDVIVVGVRFFHPCMPARKSRLYNVKPNAGRHMLKSKRKLSYSLLERACPHTILVIHSARFVVQGSFVSLCFPHLPQTPIHLHTRDGRVHMRALIARMFTKALTKVSFYAFDCLYGACTYFYFFLSSCTDLSATVHLNNGSVYTTEYVRLGRSMYRVCGTILESLKYTCTVSAMQAILRIPSVLNINNQQHSHQYELDTSKHTRKPNNTHQNTPKQHTICARASLYCSTPCCLSTTGTR